MNDCQHDPMYTTDGRCTKCYPPKRVIMVQHVDGRVEIDDAPEFAPLRWNPKTREMESLRPGYIVNPAAQMWGIDSNDLPEDTPKDWHDIKGDCAL